MKKIFFYCVCFFQLLGCASNPFMDSYNDIKLSGVKIRNPKEVKLIETTDMKNRVLEYKNRGYCVVGVSHFSGEWVARANAIKVARKKGANLVILSAHFTGTQTNTYVTAMPTTQTTYHQGNINTSSYTYGNVRGYGGGSYTANTMGHTYYSGTSTTIGTNYFQSSYDTALYEQVAVFLAPKEEVR